MKLITIAESGSAYAIVKEEFGFKGASRRSFLKTAGRVGAAIASSNPLQLAKTLTAVPSKNFDVIQYGASLFNTLNQAQKNNLDQFMFWVVNDFNTNNVSSFRNADLRGSVPRTSNLGTTTASSRFLDDKGFVVKDGMVYKMANDEVNKTFEPFPIDAIFGQYDKLIDPDDPQDFFDVFLSGSNTISFMEKVLPGSVGSIFNKFADNIGYDGLSKVIRDHADEWGDMPIETVETWLNMISINPKLQSFLGIEGLKTKSDAIKAVKGLVNNNLISKSEASVAMQSVMHWKTTDPKQRILDYEQERTEAAKNVRYNRQRRDEEIERIKKAQEEQMSKKAQEEHEYNRMSDRKWASPMHQPFESRLEKVLRAIL